MDRRVPFQRVEQGQAILPPGRHWKETEVPRRSKSRCQDPTAAALLALISDIEKQAQASFEIQLGRLIAALATGPR